MKEIAEAVEVEEAGHRRAEEIAEAAEVEKAGIAGTAHSCLQCRRAGNTDLLDRQALGYC